MQAIITAILTTLSFILIGFHPSTTSPSGTQQRRAKIQGSDSVKKIDGEPTYWLKWGHDISNTSWNSDEIMLNTTNVNPQMFGKVWQHAVAGQVYAQPLYVSRLSIAGGTHDVVFVATEHNQVYAFEAHTAMPPYDKPLWQADLGPSVSANVIGCGDLTPEIGVTATPAIDMYTKRMYVVAKTLENSAQVWRVHALDITTGKEVAGWGIVVKTPSNAPRVFNAGLQHNRGGLTLANNRLYIGFGSHCDINLNNYHGWVFSYSTSNPTAPPQIWNSTPTSTGASEAAAGIWSAGASPAVDQYGDLYLMTGNGPMNVDLGLPDIGDACVKLRTNHGASLGITGDPADYFSPANQVFLDAVDADLGSGGLCLIPNQPYTSTPRMLVGGGKDAVMRLINRDNMGGFTGRSNQNAANNVIQEVGGFPNGFWSTPAYANAGAGPSVYVNAVGDRLKQFRLGVTNTGKSHLTFVAQSQTNSGYPSCTPVVSSRGSIAGTGVVWMLNGATGALHAFDATNVGLELYNSNMNPGRDGFGNVIKFTVPIVMNGSVYAAGDNKIACYGLLGN